MIHCPHATLSNDKVAPTVVANFEAIIDDCGSEGCHKKYRLRKT
jgi:cytochrome c556